MSSNSYAPHGVYGVMAEFDTPTDLVRAAEAASEAGYRKMDAYTPFPIEDLHHALHLPKSKMSLIVLLGGICGGLTGFILQWYITVYNFPTNIGGRPLFSWPSYIVITFELTILFAAFAATFGLLALCGFPMPYHPTFNVPGFERATRDGFFLCIEAHDPLFDVEGTKSFLKGLDPKGVSEVAN
jgi:Protein of unknown function (DUF3341)